MNMQERLKELIMGLNPDVRAIVAEVITLERDHLDQQQPRIKNNIRDIVDKYARHGVESDEA